MDIAPEVYGPYITYENGKAVLYLESLKAFCGMLIESLLLYQKLRKYLKTIGFKVNPYDPCVAKNMIHDKKNTINWHVDDLKVSRAENDIVDAFIEWTKDTYEDVTKLKPPRVKIHYYLSMTLDYTASGGVKLFVKE